MSWQLDGAITQRCPEELNLTVRWAGPDGYTAPTATITGLEAGTYIHLLSQVTDITA